MSENLTCKRCKTIKSLDEYYKKPYSGKHLKTCKICITQSRKDKYIKKKTEKIYQTEIKKLGGNVIEELKNNLIKGEKSIMSLSNRYGVKYHYLRRWIKYDFAL